MDELTAFLVVIGINVLIAVMAVLALYVLLARQWGRRQAVRRMWHGTLVVSVFFGVTIFGALGPLRWSYNWFVLLSHYNIRQIAEDELYVEEIIKSPERIVVFSNGERRPIRTWPIVLHSVLFCAWFAFTWWLTRWVARRFAPTAWAQFAENLTTGSRSNRGGG